MKFTVYRDKKKQWRWKLQADNNRKIANSGESYKKRQHAIDMVFKIIGTGTETDRANLHSFKKVGEKGGEAWELEIEE